MTLIQGMFFIFIQKFEKGHGSYDATTRVVRGLAAYALF